MSYKLLSSCTDLMYLITLLSSCTDGMYWSAIFLCLFLKWEIVCKIIFVWSFKNYFVFTINRLLVSDFDFWKFKFILESAHVVEFLVLWIKFIVFQKHNYCESLISEFKCFVRRAFSNQVLEISERRLTDSDWRFAIWPLDVICVSLQLNECVFQVLLCSYFATSVI